MSDDKGARSDCVGIRRGPRACQFRLKQRDQLAECRCTNSKAAVRRAVEQDVRQRAPARRRARLADRRRSSCSRTQPAQLPKATEQLAKAFDSAAFASKLAFTDEVAELGISHAAPNRLHPRKGLFSNPQ